MELSSEQEERMKTKIERLVADACELAIGLGASAAGSIPAGEVPIDESLTEYCVSGCDSYGRSGNCPPHAGGAALLRESLGKYETAVIFKISVSGAVLMDERRYPVMAAIHRLAVRLEEFSANNGYPHSRGLACGSCHRLFCTHHKVCQALEPGGKCLFPDLARPSISGFGINVFEVAARLGWRMERVGRASDPAKIADGMLCGMVLIG